MNFNVRLFQAVNKLVGKNRWLDAFGRAGAEWVVVAMFGWYVASVVSMFYPDTRGLAIALAGFGGAALLGWLINILIGLIVQEPRPHVTYPESKLLFQPSMSWKSFPSDHAMMAWLLFFLAVLFNVAGAEGLAILAVWVCWGRVFAGVHYPVDIIAGALVAALAAMSGFTLLLFIF